MATFRVRKRIWLVVICILTLLTLYPLSMGPAMLYVVTQNPKHDLFAIYTPLALLATIPEIGKPLAAYLTWWMPDGHPPILASPENGLYY